MMSTSDAGVSQHWTQADYMRLLKKLFQKETPHAYVKNAFEFFENNFVTQPNLINDLVDYYFIYGINSSSNDTESTFEYNLNITSNSKSIIDLICLIPDDLCNKLLDKILEFMNKFPMQQPQQSFSNFFERVTNLIILLCYRKKNWLVKLLTHQLLAHLLRILKSNSNLTELITVHSCLLFVLLINVQPVQMFQHHSESLFQIFIYFFRFQCTLEQRGSLVNEIALSSVKWSVRLYFYVLYGFNASQLIQYLKRRDPQILTKEAFTQIFFYVRMNPSLLKDKSDSDKQIKILSDDISLEWRRYCLDPLCTNYNEVIQNMQNGCAKTDQTSVVNNFYNKNADTLEEYKYLLTPTSTTSNVSSSTEKINSLLTLNNIQDANGSSQPLLSPSYLFASNNKTGDNEKGHKQALSAHSSAGLTAFAYPSSSNLLPDNSDEPNINRNSTIKNLTAQFMDESSNMTSIESQYLNEAINSNPIRPKLSKARSKSDTNLSLDMSSTTRLFKSIPSQQASDGKKIIPPEAETNKPKHRRTEPDASDPDVFNYSLQQRRLTSCDIRLTPQLENKKSTFKMDQFIKSLSNSLNQSLTSQEYDKKVDQQSNDVIGTYLKNMNCLKSDIEVNSTTVPSVISKLKEEMNHIVLQLIHERHLREKYEGEANRLHFIKIQRDQLIIEKEFSEKKLKQLVEQYKNEVEESLNSQNKLELNAFKEEVREKSDLIEDLQGKLDTNMVNINDLQHKFDDMKLELKKIGKDYAESVQTLEKEQNNKTKIMLDYQYISKLKFTTETLRKKLLVMSKSQLNLKANYQKQLKSSFAQDAQEAIPNFCLNCLNNSTSSNDQAQLEYLCSLKSNQQKQPGMLKSDPSTYHCQQSTINNLKEELEVLQKSYDQLLIEHNSHAVELDDSKRNIKLKDIKIEELNQSIQMDSIEINAEIIKNQYRVYSSLMNVNKRLEEEILRLKAQLTEKSLRFEKLEKKLTEKTLENQRLLNHVKNSNNTEIAKSVA